MQTITQADLDGMEALPEDRSQSLVTAKLLADSGYALLNPPGGVSAGSCRWPYSCAGLVRRCCKHCRATPCYARTGTAGSSWAQMGSRCGWRSKEC